MPTCEHCQELLLDYVYGLLEERDLQELQAHLGSCSSCQTVLAATQAERKLLAHAARAISNVPEFTLPTSQPAEASPTAPTVPLMVPSLTKRAFWRRPWIAWSTAAVVLIALGASVVSYRHEVHARQTALADAKRMLKSIDQQIAALPAKCEAEQAATLQSLRAQTGPYLHVVGPTTLQPHGKAPIQITTRGIEGEPLASAIRLKLVEPETGNVLYLTRIHSDGQVRGNVDTSNAKPNTTLNLVVEADTAQGLARLQETVRVPEPTFVTRLDINKTTYQMKDVVFFRALILDRYSLTPPSEKMAMRAELKNPAGLTAAYVDLESRDGGIVAGELPITEHFPAGTYTLRVAPTKSSRVQAVAQNLEVVRELPGIRLDQPRYAMGGMLTGNVTLPRNYGGGAKAKGTFGTNPAVDVTLKAESAADKPSAAAPAGPGGMRPFMNAAKQAEDAQVFRFQMPIPNDLPAGESQVPLTLEYKDGDRFARRKILVPLEPTEFAIDFFPEGGDLIEGVKNRVFYRVRSKTGEPVAGEGRVILLTGKNDIVDTHYKLGLGYLDFTPDSKETYTIRITTPLKVVEIANPFANPGIRKEGVVLHVPRAVGKEGDAIRLVLRQKAPSAKLVLLAHSRGQIVDQRTVELKPGKTDVTLQPAANAHGMIRVTAYEVVGNQLQPLAERLVFRAPAQRLDLGFALNTNELRPGLQNLRAKVRATDEKGQPAPAWVLASVVDERFQPRTQTLSAHFLLLNEIRSGADFDNAQLILNDSPESTQVLERFLGTHGWRRFVPAEEPLLAVNRPGAGRQSLLFSRENSPLPELQDKFLAKRRGVLLPLHEAALQREADLHNERDSMSQAASLAQQRLFEFEYDVQVVIRTTLGIVFTGLLLVSLVMMAIGLYRLVRAHKVATPAFGGAFVGLAACLTILMVGNSLGTLEHPMIADRDRAPMASAINKALNKMLAEAPKPQVINERPLDGVFELAALGKTAERELQTKAAKADAKADRIGFGGGMARGAALTEPAKNALAEQGRMETAAAPLRSLDELRAPIASNRYESARAHSNIPLPAAMGGAKPQVGTLKPPALAKDSVPSGPAMAPAPAVRGKPATALGAAAPRIEYFHQHVPNLRADTLLWHPALKLEQGSAEVHFDIASGQATYRVLLLAHGPSGRFGFYETRLDVPDSPGR